MRALNIFLILVLFFLQYRLWLGEGSVRHSLDLQTKISEQTQRNQKIIDRNALLAAEVVSLQTGDVSMEEYARSQLGMIKSNETFFLVMEPSSNAVTSKIALFDAATRAPVVPPAAIKPSTAPTASAGLEPNSKRRQP